MLAASLLILWAGVPRGLATGEEAAAAGAAAGAPETNPGLVAETWPFDRPAATAAQRTFETWRSRNPPGPATTLPLDKLEIPARKAPAMVRVRGDLVAP